MLSPAALRRRLQELGAEPLDAVVYRHMLGDYPPATANVRGARWNPPQIAAIYASLARETALAEAEYHLSLQTPPIRARRTIYSIHVALQQVVFLDDLDLLAEIGIPQRALSSNNLSHCQRVGAAVVSLQWNGLVVPSVRDPFGGVNLVIYPGRRTLGDAEFQVIAEEAITSSESPR